MKGLLFILLIFLSTYLRGQDIRAGIIGGVNLTQVDGDQLAGYHKVGLNVGGTAIWQFSDKFSANFELLYAQKGSSSLPGKHASNVKFKLDYIEVPVLFNYHDKSFVSFGAGLSLSTLVRQYININGYSKYDIASKRDICWIVNASYFFKEHWAFNIRYSYSMFGIVGFQSKFLWNNVISVRFIYLMGVKAVYGRP